MRADARRLPGRGAPDPGEERTGPGAAGGQPARTGRAGHRASVHLAAALGDAEQGPGARVPDRKLDEELPPKRLHGLETTYRLFGLLPDTLQLRPLLIDLYTEQVAGFYDPDSATLFGVEGADRTQLSLVLAHELIHALQGQHLPLDSILDARENNDRLSAAQAMLEGQATLASLEVLAPGHDVAQNPQFWELYREQVRRQQSSMPVFRRAPLVLRETLIFPYLAGRRVHALVGERTARDSMPYGPLMPVSTEQMLHPDRYARGDLPVPMAFPTESGVVYEDVLGEAEIRVILATPGRIGRGADRAADRLGRGPLPALRAGRGAGPGVVRVWDDARSAERFMRSAAALRNTAKRGYRSALDSLTVGRRPATRYVLAPEGWGRWEALPEVTAR